MNSLLALMNKFSNDTINEVILRLINDLSSNAIIRYVFTSTPDEYNNFIYSIKELLSCLQYMIDQDITYDDIKMLDNYYINDNTYNFMYDLMDEQLLKLSNKIDNILKGRKIDKIIGVQKYLNKHIKFVSVRKNLYKIINKYL